LKRPGKKEISELAGEPQTKGWAEVLVNKSNSIRGFMRGTRERDVMVKNRAGIRVTAVREQIMTVQ